MILKYVIIGMAILYGSIFIIRHRGGKKASVFFSVLFYICLLITAGLGVCDKIQPAWMTLIFESMIFVVGDANVSYLRKTYEEQMNEYQDKVVSNQVEEVQSIYMTMRGWRHDYHNHMQTLKAHLALQQYEQMEEYLNQLDGELRTIDFLYKTGNINIDAILSSKLSLALAKDISIHCKAQVPESLQVSDVDLCVVIGNLIDNAIESCDELAADEERFIRVYIGMFKKQLYVSVTNATKELVRKLDSEYVTKKRGNHGHGLKRIDMIVEKYDGFINRKNEPGVFVTEVMLPL